MKKSNLLIVGIIGAFSLAIIVNKVIGGNQPKGDGRVVLHFQNVVGNKHLQLNDTLNKYINANGDDFIVTMLKYYVSNINFIRDDGRKIAVPESYLLVNAASPSTSDQVLTGIPDGKYKGISFTIGVDSARNFAGAQTGSLDPANGMFWSWNSGYVFLKFEGVSSRSKAKNKRLIFHIGGVKAPVNTVRYFSQNFDHPLTVGADKSAQIALTADAAALFKGKTAVDFAKFNFTMGGPNSLIIADNYGEGLFKVTEVKN
jgi:hypothetical protein